MRAFLARVWQRPWLMALLIALGYFFLQYLSLDQYGVTWDEPLHRNWGKLFAVYWQTGNYEAIEVMPGKGMYYGPLYYFLNFWLSEWMYSKEIVQFVASNHVLNLLTTSIGVGVLFALARTIGTWVLALSATAFFVLFPQLVAHAHYNPKDIPLMVALLLTATFFVAALKKKSRALLLLSAAAFGVAFSLKVSALMMAPVFLVTYLFWLHEQGGVVQGLLRQWKTILGGFVLFFVGAYIFWPSAWLHPWLIVESLSLFTGADFWPGNVLFFGQQYAGAELPWYYTSLEYLMATPLLVLVFLCVGFALLVGRMRRKQSVWMSLFLLLWVVFPLLVSMKPNLVRYDGIRQFFFILPALVIIAGVGFEFLVRSLYKKSQKSSAVLIFSLLVGMSLVMEVVRLHPFQGSYRNEIVRAMIPDSMDRVLEIEYWGATYKQGIDWLVLNAKPNAEICVPTAGILVTWYPWRHDFTFACSPESDYIMFFTRYTEAGNYAVWEQEPVYRIRRMNADLLKIYEV